MDKEVFKEIICEKVLMSIMDQHLLKGVDLRIEQGERVAIIGPNAAGKSTLLKIIAGEMIPSGGRVLLNGMEIRCFPYKKRARILTKVPQRTKGISGFSVQEYVAMGRYPYQGFTRKFSYDDTVAVQRALQRTNLESLAERSMQGLSGGEQQRVLLAQALAQETSLLLLDEPNSYLDLRYELLLMDLLMRLNKENGMTIIVVLHDLNLAAAFADRVILLNEGKIVGDGIPRDVLNEESISRVYGVQTKRVELPGDCQFHFIVGKFS